jgi:tRNA threonylcarbamoyladenosine biosynthesis protein TsaB
MNNNILAVTACLKRCSIAIVCDNHICEINENLDAPENLVWLASKLIESQKINIKNLKEIITTSGPGSFTGIRTAQSFAKAMALALKIPLFVVNYFDVIAHIGNDNNACHELIVIKHKKDLAYFRHGQEIGIAFHEQIAAKITKNTLLLGDAVREILNFVNFNIEYKEIVDFRDAKYLRCVSHKKFSEKLGL